MPGWENFFVTQVGASALAGLVFIGISINLPKIVNMPFILAGIFVLIQGSDGFY